MNKKRILIVAAHPDDEVLGCGGTAARLVGEGADAFTLILGEGVTSRDASRDPETRRGALALLKRQALAANRALGIREVFFGDLPDNRFDSVPLLDIVKRVESVKREVRPDMVFTHYGADLNIDHRITYQAAITAARPLKGESVKEIYSFEVLSSTEWNYPLSFSPDVFWDISGRLKTKLRAMRAYPGELARFPHPRSLEGIELSAKYWGMRTGLRAAEAFKSVRALR
ncbi:MAG: GlcNAc-PI de-N-acetylase [Verrucomicrobia bacterium GWF2_62_7]|nr:MAG: GlcNAc-PI de-N-acetylase [Verrucomicrobia bacterium GWF2_62_7]